MTDTTYSLDDLAERSATPVRTIRYYIQRGLVSRPVGEKRGAHYTARHLEELLQIRQWVGAGMSLERIGALLKGEAAPPALPLPASATEATVKLHRRLAPGIELVIDPQESRLTPQDTEALIDHIRKALSRHHKNQ